MQKKIAFSLVVVTTITASLFAQERWHVEYVENMGYEAFVQRGSSVSDGARTQGYYKTDKLPSITTLLT